MVHPESSAGSAAKIRRAALGDVDSIAQIHLEAWRIGYRGLIPDSVLAGLSFAARSRLWRRALTENQYPGLKRTISVVTLEERVVGFAAYGTAPPHRVEERLGQVYSIYVHPELWRRGLGRRLLASASDHLSQIGMVDADLWTIVGNSDAEEFYESCGWLSDGTTRTIGADGLDDFTDEFPETRFTKRLDPPLST